jgi:hypothetical protein
LKNVSPLSYVLVATVFQCRLDKPTMRPHEQANYTTKLHPRLEL